MRPGAMRCLLRIVGEGRCAWSRLRNPLLVAMAPHLRTHTKGFRVPREMLSFRTGSTRINLCPSFARVRDGSLLLPTRRRGRSEMRPTKPQPSTLNPNLNPASSHATHEKSRCGGAFPSRPACHIDSLPYPRTLTYATWEADTPRRNQSTHGEHSKRQCNDPEARSHATSVHPRSMLQGRIFCFCPAGQICSGRFKSVVFPI